MTSADVMRLNAAARGDISLAEARGVGSEALAAARALAAFVARGGRPALAVRILSGLVALDPSDVWSWRTLAALRLARGDAAGAAHAAEHAAARAQQRGRTDFVAALLAGRAFLAQGRGSAARPWLSVAASSEAPAAVARLARALVRRTAAA